MDCRIFPPEEILETTVALPPSKSLITRALVLEAVAGRKPGSTLAAASDVCDDTHTLSSVLAEGLPTDGRTVDINHAGTAMRFLAALYAASPGTDCVLTGSPRMLCRPIQPLAEALKTLGADIEYMERDGYPPLRIKGRQLSGGTIEIDASVSSQFISALMMVAPLMDSALTIRLLGNVQSMPYISMTAGMMLKRGIEVEIDPDGIKIAPGKYRTAEPEIEPDWSAAAFWYEIAALSAGWVTLPGLLSDSLQGDRGCATLFERLGVITENTDEGIELSATPDLYGRLDADMSEMPDIVPALVVTACLAGIPFELSGVGALRHKESDRLEALVTSMGQLGMPLEIDGYGTVLRWDGRRKPVTELPVFDTCNDHRLAMALAPVSIFVPGIIVRDMEVVTKSYPEYWSDLARAGFSLTDAAQPIEEA